MKRMLAVSILFVTAPAMAQDAATAPAPPAAPPPAHAPAPILIDRHEAEWRFEFTPQMWAMGLSGEVTVRGLSAEPDASFLDVLDSSDSLIGLAARFEIGTGKWTGFVDGSYAKIGVEDATGPAGLTDIDITTTIVLIDFGVMYRIGEWPIGDAASSNDSTVSLDLYAGARYMSGSVDIEPALAASRSQDQNWIDPIIGAEMEFRFCDHWRLTLRGDIGGFGVSSDFTWSAFAVIGYEFTLFDLPWTVFAGYKAVGADYADGSGADRFEWDAVMHGPIMGVAIRF